MVTSEQLREVVDTLAYLASVKMQNIFLNEKLTDIELCNTTFLYGIKFLKQPNEKNFKITNVVGNDASMLSDILPTLVNKEFDLLILHTKSQLYVAPYHEHCLFAGFFLNPSDESLFLDLLNRKS